MFKAGQRSRGRQQTSGAQSVSGWSDRIEESRRGQEEEREGKTEYAFLCACYIWERRPTHAVSRTASARRESAAYLNRGSIPAQCNTSAIFMYSPESQAGSAIWSATRPGVVYICRLFLMINPAVSTCSPSSPSPFLSSQNLSFPFGNPSRYSVYCRQVYVRLVWEVHSLCILMMYGKPLKNKAFYRKLIRNSCSNWLTLALLFDIIILVMLKDLRRFDHAERSQKNR